MLLRPRRAGAAMLLPFVAALLIALVMAACGAGSSGPDEDAAERADGSTTVDPATGAEPPSTTAAVTSSTTEPPVAPPPSTAASYTPVVYDGDFSVSVAPILAEKCASCHAPGGPGTAHWTLASAADAADHHQALLEVVEGGFMPPWPAGGDSPAFVGDRSLRDDQLEALVAWARDGGPLDVDRSRVIEPAVEVVGLSDPDLTLVPDEPYAGTPEVTDDYRCQIYDPQLPDGGWITAYEFVPDRTDVVHHAIGYLIPADRRDRAEARDGEDGRPGWSCYGSSGLGRDEIFLGWAPGQDPSVMPEGAGLWVEPGAFIVVQVHYHYEAEAPADHSALAVELASPETLRAAGGALDPITVGTLLAPAEIPCSDAEEGPLCDRQAAIRAARQKYGADGVLADAILALCRAEVADFATMTDGTATSSCDLPAAFLGATGEVVSVLGHQHEIGSWFRMTLNPDRPDEKVLLDIPDWDFDWQYNYDPVEEIVIDADDVIRVECGWDRARRDPLLEPAYVLWADGTDDEMCFATITTRPI